MLQSFPTRIGPRRMRRSKPAIASARVRANAPRGTDACAWANRDNYGFEYSLLLTVSRAEATPRTLRSLAPYIGGRDFSRTDRNRRSATSAVVATLVVATPIISIAYELATSSPVASFVGRATACFRRSVECACRLPPTPPSMPHRRCGRTGSWRRLLRARMPHPPPRGARA
jgi:hypothetical protein